MGAKYCRSNRKQIEVIKAFYIDEETIFLENALLK
jgi:hypothetical protein